MNCVCNRVRRESPSKRFTFRVVGPISQKRHAPDLGPGLPLDYSTSLRPSAFMRARVRTTVCVCRSEFLVAAFTPVLGWERTPVWTWGGLFSVADTVVASWTWGSIFDFLCYCHLLSEIPVDCRLFVTADVHSSCLQEVRSSMCRIRTFGEPHLIPTFCHR